MLERLRLKLEEKNDALRCADGNRTLQHDVDGRRMTVVRSFDAECQLIGDRWQFLNFQERTVIDLTVFGYVCKRIVEAGRVLLLLLVNFEDVVVQWTRGDIEQRVE